MADNGFTPRSLPSALASQILEFYPEEVSGFMLIEVEEIYNRRLETSGELAAERFVREQSETFRFARRRKVRNAIIKFVMAILLGPLLVALAAENALALVEKVIAFF